MLKEILSFIVLVVILGIWFWLVLNLSQKKIWRIVNVSWGFGIWLFPNAYFVINGFHAGPSAGFKILLLVSIIFFGGLVSMKGMIWLTEKAITSIDKLEHKLKGKG